MNRHFQVEDRRKSTVLRSERGESPCTGCPPLRSVPALPPSLLGQQADMGGRTATAQVLKLLLPLLLLQLLLSLLLLLLLLLFEQVRCKCLRLAARWALLCGTRLVQGHRGTCGGCVQSKATLLPIEGAMLRPQ